jgi:Uma2 family endonuclease
MEVRMSIPQLETQATIADLERVPGKAEIVNGKLVLMSPTGDDHNTAVLNISTSLKLHQRAYRGGRPYTDNGAFILSPTRTVSPDVSWYVGPRTGSKFLRGAPLFAVEIRSESNYGPAAEREMAWKRADYFAAGTQIVWDVDVLREGVIRVYRAPDPENPTLYRRGEVAEAEPAVPGWRFPVDELWD